MRLLIPAIFALLLPASRTDAQLRIGGHARTAKARVSIGIGSSGRIVSNKPSRPARTRVAIGGFGSHGGPHGFGRGVLRGPQNRGTQRSRGGRSTRVVRGRGHGHRARGRIVRSIPSTPRIIRSHRGGDCRPYRPQRRARGCWKVIRERVWCPPVYEWRYDSCGRSYRVCVRQGYYHYVSRRVWVCH